MTASGFYIGKYKITGGVLAPMAGYTDIAFRELCRELGAGLTPTEMVSVRGLVRDNANTEILTRISERESPSCVQLFGNDPDEFARAAAQRLDAERASAAEQIEHARVLQQTMRFEA